MKQATTLLLLAFFFLGLSKTLSAQQPQGDQLDLYGSWREEAPGKAWRAEYRPAAWPDTLWLALRHASVDSVFWREGRRKQALEFFIDAPKGLGIAIPTAAEARAAVEIFYRLDWEALAAAAYLERWASVYKLEFALDSLEAGAFFPRRSGSRVFKARFHLSLPPHWRYQGDFSADFSVEHPQGQAYYFEQEWRDAGIFRLELGRATDLANYAAAENTADRDSIAEIAFQAKAPATVVSKAVGKLKIATPLPLAPAASTERQPLLAGFFFYPEELPQASRDREAFAREQVLALSLHDNDTAAARRAHWQFYVQAEGEEWARALLQRRYRLQEWSDSLFWEEYLARYLAETAPGRNLSDTALGESLKQWPGAALSTAAYLVRERRPLPLSLRYRYHGPSRSLELLATGDYRPSQLLAVPLRVFWQDRDSLHQLDTTFIWDEEARLRLPTQGSPRNAFVQLPAFSAIELSEERPENYYLYELVKAPEEERKQAALEYLLETENPKLLATVIGLALAGNEAELQIRALEKAPQLKPEGLLRLKSSLERVARDAAREELRLLARLALQRLND